MSHTFASRRVANRRRRNEAREQILDVARQELKTKPFRDLSVDELMRATGLSRTAFYRYFPDREAVLVDLLEEVWGALAEARDADAENETVSVESLTRLAQLLGENRAVLKAIADAAPGDEDVERAYNAFMHSYWIDDLTDRIERAQEQGLATGLDPELAGEALGWMAERLVTQSQDRDPRQVLDTIVAILIKCLFSGDSTAGPGSDGQAGAEPVAQAASSEPADQSGPPEPTTASAGAGAGAGAEAEAGAEADAEDDPAG
jgi:AcrR family transcriptional regulator